MAWRASRSRWGRVAAASTCVLASCSASDDSSHGDGESASAATTVATSRPPDLPELHLRTGGDATIGLEAYVEAEVRVVDRDGSQQVVSTEVRGRGNSTWGMPKKPYRLRLADAVPLLGLPADRDWALLANYADKSLIRNRLAAAVGTWIGVPSAPRHAVVELHINGSYEGVYDLSQQLEVGPHAIAIDELDPDIDTGEETITGGYFLEIDHRRNEEVCWSTPSGVPICSKDPEFDPIEVEDPMHPSSQQLAYIKDYLAQAEQAVMTPGDGYEQYFDRDALVSWFIVSEVFRNNDSRITASRAGSTDFTSSVMLYKPRGEPLVMGPLWDFDLAVGNVDFNGNSEPIGWWVRDSLWLRPLLAHSSFGRHVFERWCELQRDGLREQVIGEIAAAAAAIGPDAIERNFERWPILGAYVWPNSFVGDTHADELAHLEWWLSTRIAWIHDQLTVKHGPCPPP